MTIRYCEIMNVESVKLGIAKLIEKIMGEEFAEDFLDRVAEEEDLNRIVEIGRDYV